MEQRDMIKSLSMFAIFAGTDILKWQSLIGCEINNNYYGLGIIDKITKAKAIDSIYLDIEFMGLPEDKRVKIFPNLSFVDGHFTSVNFDLSLIQGFNNFCEMKIQEENDRLIQEKEKARKIKEQEEQIGREKKALKEYNCLKANYGLSSSSFSSIASPLYMILLKLESEEDLDEEDIKWLEKNKVYAIIALYYERNYLKTGDLWNLVRASSNLRKINNSSKVIELLKDKYSHESKLMSALLTTNGGAYRDINELRQAEKLAKEAIRINNKNYYSYNLLGAIYYQIGIPEEGDKFFIKAIELGSSSKIMDLEIENSIKRASEDERARVVNYLLNKDEQKYQWAKFYIN